MVHDYLCTFGCFISYYLQSQNNLDKTSLDSYATIIFTVKAKLKKYIFQVHMLLGRFNKTF